MLLPKARYPAHVAWISRSPSPLSHRNRVPIRTARQA